MGFTSPHTPKAIFCYKGFFRNESSTRAQILFYFDTKSLIIYNIGLDFTTMFFLNCTSEIGNDSTTNCQSFFSEKLFRKKNQLYWLRFQKEFDRLGKAIVSLVFFLSSIIILIEIFHMHCSTVLLYFFSEKSLYSASIYICLLTGVFCQVYMDFFPSFVINPKRLNTLLNNLKNRIFITAKVIKTFL